MSNGQVKTTFSLDDKMTPQLIKITKTLETVIREMKSVEGVSKKSLNSAEAQCKSANRELLKMQREAEKAAQKTKKIGDSTKTIPKGGGTGFFRGIENGARKAGSAVDATKGKIAALKGGLAGLGSAVMGFYGIYKGIDLVKGSLSSAVNVSTEKTKLAEVMGAMQGAKKQDVDSVEAVISKESSSGVVGGNAQRAGAQQISTYLHQTKAVRKLIPAMNDLAVQMHGTETTQEDMVNIANMTGKVFAGQVGALRRAGISFDEHQEKVLKNGTELQKAAMLVKVFKQNVGNMNQEMAKTPQGQYKQMQMEMGGVKAQMGAALLPTFIELAKVLHENQGTVAAFGTAFAGAVKGGVQGAISVFKQISNVIKALGLDKATKKTQDMGKTFEKVGKAVTIALTVFLGAKVAIGIISTLMSVVSGAATAIRLFGAALKFVAANPVILLIVGIVAAVIYLWKHCESFRNFWIGVWNKVRSTISAVVAAISPIIQSVRDKLQPVIDKIKELWQKAGGLQGVMTTAWNVIKTVITVAATAIYTALLIVTLPIRTLIGAIRHLWNTSATFRGICTAVWGAIRKIVVTVVKSIINRIQTWINTFSKVVSAIKQVLDKTGALKKVKEIIKDAWSGLKRTLTSPFSAVLSTINSVIDAFKTLADYASRDYSPKKGAGGGTANPTVGKAGKNATGTRSWKGGWTWVGERGPELVNLNPGTKILNHKESMQATTTKQFSIAKIADSIVVREDADIDRIATALVKKLTDVQSDAVLA